MTDQKGSFLSSSLSLAKDPCFLMTVPDSLTPNLQGRVPGKAHAIYSRNVINQMLIVNSRWEVNGFSLPLSQLFRFMFEVFHNKVFGGYVLCVPAVSHAKSTSPSGIYMLLPSLTHIQMTRDQELLTVVSSAPDA